MKMKQLGAICFVAGLLLAPAAWATTLVEAAQDDDAQAVLDLLKAQDTDVNAASDDGTTALHWAVYNNNLALVDALIAAGAKVATTNAYDSSPMSEAATIGNPAVIRKLLEAGADVDSTNAEGQTALMLVARTSNVDAAQVLIDFGADVNAEENWRGQTALIWAAAQSQPEMLRLLIANGADVNARTWVNDWERQITAEPRYMWRPLGGFTALIYAAREGCTECAKLLVEAGANINQPDGEGATPLLIALINLNFDFAKYLIEQGADVNRWDMRGNQPLFAAVDMNTLPAGGYPDRPSLDDTTALEVIDLLLAKGANPNAQLRSDRLLYRSISDDRGTDSILVIGATPLLRAAKAFDIAAIERLLASGALPNLPNDQGVTPVMAAAGLYSRLGDTRGDYRTPDVQQNSIRALEKLIEGGGLPNSQDVQGNTALHGAASWGWTSVIDYLLASGADPLLRNRAGATYVEALKK